MKLLFGACCAIAAVCAAWLAREFSLMEDKLALLMADNLNLEEALLAARTISERCLDGTLETYAPPYQEENFPPSDVARWDVDTAPYSLFLPIEEGGQGEIFSTLYAQPRRAVLLTNVPNITTAAEVFANIPSDAPTVFEKRSPDQISTSDQDSVEYGRGSFAEFFELLQSDTDDVYMTVQTPVLFNPIIANLRKDIFVGPNSFTRFISDQKQYQYNMWCGRQSLGAKPTRTPLHYDYHDNMYYVIQGRKEFRLLPPHADVPTVEKHCMEHGLSHEDCEKFGPPHFSFKTTDELDQVGVVAQRVTVSAGEILYMPARWHHEVHSIRDEADDTDDDSHHAGVHLALNAWNEPPR